MKKSKLVSLLSLVFLTFSGCSQEKEYRFTLTYQPKTRKWLCEENKYAEREVYNSQEIISGTTEGNFSETR